MLRTECAFADEGTEYLCFCSLTSRSYPGDWRIRSRRPRRELARWYLMHRDGPIARTPMIAVPGKLPGLLVLFMLLLRVGFFSATATAAPAMGANPSAKTGQAPPPPGEFVRQETCATCHAEGSQGFASHPHSKLA